MSTKAYLWNKSVITERCSSVDTFITIVNDFINGTIQTSDSLTQLSPVQQSTLSQQQQSTIEQHSLTQSAPVNPLTPSQQQLSTPCIIQQQSVTQSTTVNPSTPSRLLQSHPSTYSPIQQHSLTQSSPSPSQLLQSPTFHQTVTPPQGLSITKKRNRILDNNQSLSKRLKCIDNSIDEEIERHRKG